MLINPFQNQRSQMKTYRDEATNKKRDSERDTIGTDVEDSGYSRSVRVSSTASLMSAGGFHGLGNDIETALLVDPQTGDDEVTKKKKFLFRLLVALHGSGNLSYRTEDYFRKVAHSMDLLATCAIFPYTVIIAFHETLQLNPHSSECYTLSIAMGWDCTKLAALDQLCFDVIKNRCSLREAEKRLQDIEDMPELYSSLTTSMFFGMASLSSTTLFFGGNWRDGGWAFLCGVVIYVGLVLCGRLKGLSEIESFALSFVVSAMTSLLDKYVYDQDLCLYGILFGGIVWLLPGLSITMSLLEVFSKQIVFGSSRLMNSLLQAAQMGLGLAIGYKCVYRTEDLPSSFEDGCRYPLNELWYFLLLPIASVCFGAILNANHKQFFGMILAAAVAQICSYSMQHVSSDASSLISAFFVSVTARLYAHFFKVRPLIYIIAGLLILVPGGVGVRGMSNGIGDVDEAGKFIFEMLIMGVCLAIGTFLALLPRKYCCSSNVSASSRRAMGYGHDEDDDSEEKLANTFSARISTERLLSDANMSDKPEI